MSITDAHLIPSDLALAIWSLTMPVNGLYFIVLFTISMLFFFNFCVFYWCSTCTCCVICFFFFHSFVKSNEKSYKELEKGRTLRVVQLRVFCNVLLKVHLNSCGKVPVNCPNVCGQSFTREMVRLSMNFFPVAAWWLYNIALVHWSLDQAVWSLARVAALCCLLSCSLSPLGFVNGLLTKCEVKMAGYWPNYFLRVHGPRLSQCPYVHKLSRKKKERGQYPAILTEQTWSIKDLFCGFWGNFSCETRWVVLTRQDHHHHLPHLHFKRR